MSRQPPGDLTAGGRGRQLWRATLATFDLTAPELLVLAEAGRCADRIDQLAALIAADGPVSTGSRKQKTLHPAVAELRMQQAQLGRLLGQLGFERAAKDDPGERGLLSLASVRASRAATARWSKQRSTDAS